MTSGILGPLRQVEGTVGSFACSSSGQLLVADLPGTTAEALGEVSACVRDLFATARGKAQNNERLTCRFEDQSLEVIALEFGFLCVVVKPEHDRQFLTVVMRMLSRRLFTNKAS